MRGVDGLGPPGEGFFFRDRRANAVFVLAFLVTLPGLCTEISARRLWPTFLLRGG